VEKEVTRRGVWIQKCGVGGEPLTMGLGLKRRWLWNAAAAAKKYEETTTTKGQRHSSADMVIIYMAAML
jgi:hypothetical protein